MDIDETATTNDEAIGITGDGESWLAEQARLGSTRGRKLRGDRDRACTE